VLGRPRNQRVDVGSVGRWLEADDLEPGMRGAPEAAIAHRSQRERDGADLALRDPEEVVGQPEGERVDDGLV
jgi:hypothetical protein